MSLSFVLWFVVVIVCWFALSFLRQLLTAQWLIWDSICSCLSLSDVRITGIRHHGQEFHLLEVERKDERVGRMSYIHLLDQNGFVFILDFLKGELNLNK